MRHILARGVAILVLFSALVPAVGQTASTPTGQAPAKQTAAPKPPDLVCWGNGPDWSVQFASWGARYLGINSPDQDFAGRFIWASEDKVWVWQQNNQLLTPMGGLSAVIKSSSCTDPVLHKTFRYSAKVTLPQGDAVNGCCRRLKPGEAPVGPHGAPSNNTPTQ
jgi:uncharacterized membrane protein